MQCSVSRSVAIILLLLASVSDGCKRNKDTAGVLIRATIPWALYVKSQTAVRESDAGGTKFSFPQIEIYNRAGYLIYSSHEALDNAQLLDKLPKDIESLKPKAGPSRLVEVLEEVPEFRNRKEQIARTHEMSILSVFLEDCHACSIQEEALSRAQRQLLDRGINLLVLSVSRAKPQAQIASNP